VTVRGATAGVAVTLCVALAACGGNGEDAATTTSPEAPGALTHAERDLVRDSESAIVEYCRRRALALTDPAKRPTAAQQADAIEAVDALISLAERKPQAQVRPRVEVRLFVGDLTENLEGSNCDPLILGRLQQGLASLPPGP
jgi:hypothetical protein